MKIKICGLNPVKDVQLCIDLNVNFLGFVFYEKSPRNIKLEDIKILKNYDKRESLFVAVCVNPTDDFIKNNLLGNFEYIQLHGDESPQRVAEIKNFGIKVNNNTINNESSNITIDDFKDDILKLSHGKKNHVLFKITH